MIRFAPSSIVAIMKAGLMYRQLHIEFGQDSEDADRHDGAILLTAQSNGATRNRGLVTNAKGFSQSEIIDAVCASGFVHLRNGLLQISNHIDCEQLAELVDQIFDDYFDAPRQPADRLRRVCEAVDPQLPLGLHVQIPLFAYAWLDLTIRIDMAELARAVDPWAPNPVQIDATRCRDRRVRELVDRYLATKNAASNRPSDATTKLAPSQRHMGRASREDSRAG